MVKKKKKEVKDDVGKQEDGSSTEEEVKEKEPGMHELKAMIEAEKDRALRLSAEFENYKKRSSKEIQDFKRFANETLLRQLLTVVDNLERAIDSADENTQSKGLLEGVKMTHKEILRIFESFEVKPLEAQGEVFDPVFHQAVTQEESEKYPENTVTKELQKGYTLHGRLLRPSMVVVSKRKSESTETESVEKEKEQKENTN